MCVVYCSAIARLRSVPSEPTGIEMRYAHVLALLTLEGCFIFVFFVWVYGVLVDVDLIHTVVGGYI
jgi:hypothetical protein